MLHHTFPCTALAGERVEVPAAERYAALPQLAPSLWVHDSGRTQHLER